jgi:hypothetical protein
VNNAQHGIDEFIEKLPYDLKLEITLNMYKELFTKHTFFDIRLRSRNRFLGWVGMRLKKSSAVAGSMIYQQGSDMSHLYLVEKGTCAFIAPKLNNAMFGVVDGKKSDAL